MAKAQESAGSDLAELKALMKVAHSKPVSVACGIGGDGKVVIKLDKMKQPKALAKELKDSDPKIKNLMHGRVAVDEDDTSTANFTMNKEGGGIQGKLIVALKGTGISTVNMTTEDAESEGGEADADSPTDVDPASAAAPDDTLPSADAAPASGTPDAGALATQLTGLVKQMMAALASNPAQKTTLVQLATTAQASMKSGDLSDAAAAMELLRQAIADTNGQDPSASAAPPPPADVAPSPPPQAAALPPDPAPSAPEAQMQDGGQSAGAQRYHKSRAVWSATRKKIHEDLHHLRKMVKEASEDEEVDIEQSFNSAIQPVLDTLNEDLSDILGKAAEAQAAERERILIHARRTIASHISFVQSNPVISHLDENPFMKLSIGKTLHGTLSALASIVK